MSPRNELLGRKLRWRIKKALGWGRWGWSHLQPGQLLDWYQLLCVEHSSLSAPLSSSGSPGLPFRPPLRRSSAFFLASSVTPPKPSGWLFSHIFPVIPRWLSTFSPWETRHLLPLLCPLNCHLSASTHSLFKVHLGYKHPPAMACGPPTSDLRCCLWWALLVELTGHFKGSHHSIPLDTYILCLLWCALLTELTEQFKVFHHRASLDTQGHMPWHSRTGA